jgi:putative oxidoreductase
LTWPSCQPALSVGATLGIGHSRNYGLSSPLSSKQENSRMAASIDAPSRTTPIALWILRALMAALFLFAAFAKLTSMQMEVDAFAMLPVGQWFRYLVGLLELAGGICVLIPTISGLGAIVLLLVDVGAFFAQILFLHQDWIHPIVIGAILVALIYLQRDAIRERLGM